MWRPYLLPDRDEMSNVYRGPSINASYQVSVQLAKQFQGRRFLEIDQSETRIACGSYIYVCLLTNRDEMSNHYSGSSIDASYQVSVHLVKWFQRRRFFRNRPIRNKNCLWRPSLLTNRDEMSNLYRGPSIHAFYQISVHSGKRFQRRLFRNQPIRNKNGLWWPCLLTDRNYMSILYREPSKDASYQVLIHLARRFQRRRFLEINQSETRMTCGGHVC